MEGVRGKKGHRHKNNSIFSVRVLSDECELMLKGECGREKGLELDPGAYEELDRGEDAGRHWKAKTCLEEKEETISRNYVGKLDRRGRVHPHCRQSYRNRPIGNVERND